MINHIGRGAIYTGRSSTGRGCGQYIRENAGISSEREARNFPVESLRFPGEGLSAQGKSGPKSRPKGVDDGQQVRNSCTTERRLNEAVTQKDSQSARTEKRVQGEARHVVKYACQKALALKGSE